MQGILTNAFLQRQAAIAKAIIPPTENLDPIYDLIKGASEPQKRKVKKVMDEWKAGTLHSGSKKGPKVTSYKQALSIAMSESGLAKAEQLDELIPEHKRLVNVLEHGDAKARKKEAKKQARELKEYEREVEKGDKMCEHGNILSKCKKCNRDALSKDMEMGSGTSDGYGVVASVEKGHGEGSRGGKVIGHTKSGKPVYDTHDHKTHKNFNAFEHHEAAKMHEKLYEDVHRGEHVSEEKKKNIQSHYAQMQKHSISSLEKYHEENPEKFFEVVSRHYEPKDDGESETKMFENLAKHKHLDKIVSQLHKKFKKSADDENDIEKAFENLLGIDDPVEAAFTELTKGGPGSNKAGRAIGTTRSGKSVHVFKEANDYKDFEAVDHLEAHKIHMNHASKVTGVAAVNSRIRAHDHEDLARIKAAKKEQEELEQKNAEGKKEQAKANGGKTKKETGKSKAKNTKSTTVKKAWDVLLSKDSVDKAFNDIFEKGDIRDAMSTYGDKTPINFSKTGKEIAAKLLAQAAIIAVQETEIAAKMATLEESIGDAPDDEQCSYNIKSIKVPRYSYSYYSQLQPAETVSTVAAAETKSDNQQNITRLCSQYNDLAYRLVSLKEDLEAIRIITENIEPKTKYKLSVGQLTSLGF